MAQPNSAPSSAPVSVIGSQFIAQDQFDIIIDRYSNGNLLITDINHKILLKVKPCTTHFHSQLVVLDADDKPIVTIREQSLSAHSGMNVFRGDSKNKSDLIFHTKKHHLIQFKTGVDVFLGNKASGKHDYDFNIKGKWSKKDCTINRGDTSATIAQMYKKKSTDKKKFVDDKFMMTIYPAVDYAFVVTLIAIVEAMEMESTSNTNEYLTATDKESSEVDIKEEANRLKESAEESEEAWKQTLASFKEQALKMLNVSQEAYEVYLKKATVVLKETSEQLKIQADKASADLSVIAKELGEEGKVYLSAAAENSPEPLKDIVETFASSSTDDLKDVSKVLDFYVGIPYGGLLTVTGFLSFMLTGSISAIRFGVILGGTLLALSIYSLRSWKKGESTSVALKGQTAIATILFLKDTRLVFTRPAFTRYIALMISGAVLAFYVYRIICSRGQSTGGSNLETGTEN